MNEIIEKESIKVENVNTLKDYNLRILGNTEQDGTPTPENPVNIRVVTGDNTINIINSNIYNLTKNVTKTDYGFINNTAVPALNSIKLKKGIKYLFSLQLKSKPTTDTTFTIYFKGSPIGKSFGSIENYELNKTYTIEYTSPEDNYLSFHIWGNANNDIFEFRLWINVNEAQEFEFYNTQSFPINLGSLELCKIGDYQDYIYKQDDKWWKHKEIEKISASAYVKSLVNITQHQSSLTKEKGTLSFRNNSYVYLKTDDNIVCNLFNHIKNTGWNNAILNNIFYTDGLCININYKTAGYSEWDANITDVRPIKNFLTANNFIAYGVLNTPIDEQITDIKLISQLNNLNNAILYSGENNIITTISPLIDGEGTSITLENTVNTPFNNIILKGNTSQNTTTGKNLFNKDTSNFINAFISGSGVLKYTSTVKTYYIECLPNMTYTISKISGKYFRVNTINTIPVNNSQCLQATITNDSTSSITITTDANAKYLLLNVYDKSADTLSEQEILNSVQIEKGSTATSYEPYTGGIASPNPDYPQDIEVVTGDNTINIINSNIYNLTKNVTKTDYGFINNTAVPALNSIKLKKGIKYLFSLQLKSKPTTDTTFTIYFKGSPIGKSFGSIENYELNKTYTIEYTSPEDNYLSFHIWGNANNDIFEFRLWINVNEAQEFEFYNTQSFPINLGSLELCKIGDYQDYIYKKDDKWWKHKEIDKIIFDGNRVPDMSSNGKLNRFSYNLRDKILRISERNLVISDKFNACLNINEDSVGSSFALNNDIYMYIDQKITTTSEVQEWFKKNNPIFYFACNPIEQQITDTTLIAQLNNLSKATTYAGETNIVATSDGNNLPVTNYIKAYSSEIINESYPYLDLKYNLPYTEKLENLDFYLNENGRLVIKNVGTYLCSISESEIPDMPEASETTVKIAGRDGDLVLATTYNPIQFSIVIYTDENLSPAEKIEERQKIYKFFHEMKNTFKTFGIEAASKFYRVKYAGDVECENHPKHLKFTLPFKSSVSYGYNFKDKELIGNNIAISNTIEPVGFKCIINGPATNPTISLNNNEMKYEASIVNNEKIIIDTNNSTVTSITDNNESNAIVHYNRVFPKIQNGKNELKILSGIDNPTQVKIEWNDYNL